MSLPAPAPIVTPEEAKAALKREVKDFVKLIVLVLAVVVLCKTFIVESCPVQGPSMSPALMQDERILVWKLPTVLSRLPLIGGFDPIEEGDLVVFDSEDEASRRYIKRVIAVGPRSHPNAVNASADMNATEVRFERGRVFINNHLLEEPYLTAAEHESPMDTRVNLEPGEYYVLGDHRSVSKDSRRFGPIAKQHLVGRALLRFWPLSKFSIL